MAVSLFPKKIKHSKRIDSNPFFEVIGLYLLIDYFLDKFNGKFLLFGNI
jgi:hypothetical protein